MERHPAVSMPTYDSATSHLNDWLGGARYRGAQEQPGLGFSGLAGLPPHANGGLLGQGYLDAMLPGQGMGGPLQHTPYTPLDASLTERQLADLYPGQLDLLSVPGLAHLDPFLGNYQEEPLFGSTSEGLQDGEDKPRSKMQEKNRRAQRRFRERQKTKFTELTGRVEELEGRLEELLSEKARLEDRTSILQTTLEMRRASSAEPEEAAVSRLDSVELSEGAGATSPSSAARQRSAELLHSPTRRAGSGPPPPPAQPPVAAGGGGDDLAEGSIRFFHDDLRLSLPCNGAHSLSPEALKNTAPQDIICLYEQYVDELRCCLGLEAADQPLTPAAVRVVKLANEISTLLLRAWALNPVSMRKLHQHLNLHAGEQGPDELRRIAAALRLSEEQRARLAAVTRRFQAQRGVLVAQRQALYARLQRPLDAGFTSDECISDFLKVHDAMSVLKMNLRQEHWETLSYASTCTQLMTPWQMATLLVESHPFWYDFIALVNVLNEGAPPS